MDVLALLLGGGLALDEGPVQGQGGEDFGEQAADGVDDEAAQQAGEAHAEEVDREGEDDLVAEGDPGVAEVLRQPLHQVHIVRVARVVGDGEDDGAEDLLLEAPGARVERVARAPHDDAPVGQDAGEEEAAGGDEQLHDDGRDVDGRLPRREEGVDGRDAGHEGQAQEVGPGRLDGRRRVVARARHGPHFGVGRVVVVDGRLGLEVEGVVLFRRRLGPSRSRSSGIGIGVAAAVRLGPRDQEPHARQRRRGEVGVVGVPRDGVDEDLGRLGLAQARDLVQDVLHVRRGGQVVRLGSSSVVRRDALVLLCRHGLAFPDGVHDLGDLGLFHPFTAGFRLLLSVSAAGCGRG